MQTCHSRGFDRLSRGLLIVLTFALPAACGIEDVIIEPPDDPGDPGDPGNPENQESIYYDLRTFASEIQPALDATSCIVAGCHDRGSAAAGLGLFSYPAQGSNEMWFNLQALTSLVQLDTYPEQFSAEDTLIFERAVDRHGGVLLDQPERLAAWLEDAAARVDFLERFDLEAFGFVQPALDEGCAILGCHQIETSAGGFGLHPLAAAGTDEHLHNFRAVARYVDLSIARAEDTFLYTRATDRHRGTAFNIDQMAMLQAWIQAALDADGAE